MLLFLLDYILMGEESAFGGWEEYWYSDIEMELPEHEWWDIMGHLQNIYLMTVGTALSVMSFVANSVMIFIKIILLDIKVLEQLSWFQWIVKIPIWAVISYSVAKLVRGG